MIEECLLALPAYPRGYHLITDKIIDCLPPLPQTGLLHVFIQHTSAALTINENADPSVRVDFESFFNHLVPEGLPEYTHTFEGLDDMPAHLKAAMLGFSISIPISQGRLNMGVWQGIYLCEFRNQSGPRKLVCTILS